MQCVQIATLALLGALFGCVSADHDRLAEMDQQGQSFKTPPPEGAKVLLGRDAIPAIWEPKFVGAEDSGLPDDAEVIGVVIEGEAHAYSINLLDRHEIVNDVVGGLAIAATW